MLPSTLAASEWMCPSDQIGKYTTSRMRCQPEESSVEAFCRTGPLDQSISSKHRTNQVVCGMRPRGDFCRHRTGHAKSLSRGSPTTAVECSGRCGVWVLRLETRPWLVGEPPPPAKASTTDTQCRIGCAGYADFLPRWLDCTSPPIQGRTRPETSPPTSSMVSCKTWSTYSALWAKAPGSLTE
jgi:hypothetical protein